MPREILTGDKDGDRVRLNLPEWLPRTVRAAATSVSTVQVACHLLEVGTSRSTNAVMSLRCTCELFVHPIVYPGTTFFHKTTVSGFLGKGTPDLPPTLQCYLPGVLSANISTEVITWMNEWMNIVVRGREQVICRIKELVKSNVSAIFNTILWSRTKLLI